ncbi:URFB1 protein, partial [Indicator maculatus]|nr:URFB1 protein [Indicator maculatus]
PALCLRFELGPAAALRSPLALQNGFLQLLLHTYTAELLMSFLTNLGPFLEDEIIPEVIPMEIEVVDAKITLKDDSPQLYPTSPGPVPITLAVDHVVVRRRDDGVFYLTGQQQQPTWGPLPCYPPRLCWRLSALKEMPELQRELQTLKMALAEANLDRARLLQEVRKYNPLFQL